MNLLFTHLEGLMSAWAAHRLKRYRLPQCVFEKFDTLPDTPTRLPKIKMNLNIKLPKNLNIISKVRFILNILIKYFITRSLNLIINDILIIL